MTIHTLPAARRTDFVRSADGTRINVEEYGPQDAPTVVLIHGWTCKTLFWAPLIHELGGEFRVVAYDQRGHGRSETPGPAATARTPSPTTSRPYSTPSWATTNGRSSWATPWAA